MDRSLDEVIAEKQKPRGSRRNGRNISDYPRDGVRKNLPRDAPRNLDRDWVHDRYEGDQYSRQPREPRERNERRVDRYTPEEDRSATANQAKIRVDNLHYDLTQTDVQELFARLGPVKSCQILYDRSDRSRGTAYVTYADVRDANRALREYDGANAYGQPIKLTLLPSGPAASGIRGGRTGHFEAGQARGANSRSLFDRIDGATSVRARTRRSESPVDRPVGGRASRRSDTTRPAPDNIDRYVPGDRRSMSPLPTRRGGRGNIRGGPREGGARREREERSTVHGRPRKTAEELDAEMEDYWGGAVPTAASEQQLGASKNTNGAEQRLEDASNREETIIDDVDMIV